MQDSNPCIHITEGAKHTSHLKVHSSVPLVPSTQPGNHSQHVMHLNRHQIQRAAK